MDTPALPESWLQYGVFWACVTVWYEDSPKESLAIEFSPITACQPVETLIVDLDGSKDAASVFPLLNLSRSLSLSPSQNFKVAPSQWGVIACIYWFAMTCFFVLGAWESNLPVFGADYPQFNWPPFAAGNFIALEDRNILAYGSGLGLVGLLIFVALLKSNKSIYQNIFICWWAVALGFNMASTVTVSLLSKQFPDSWNDRTSLAIQYSNYTGHVTGAIKGGSGVRVAMLSYVGLETAFIGIGAMLFSFWQSLKIKTG